MRNLCECGCGNDAGVWPRNHKRFGYIKGEPRHFIVGHNNKTPEARARSAELARALGTSRVGVKNHLWKGDEADYTSIHQWVQRHFPKTGKCEKCGAERKTELSNPSHTYRRVREDWTELCIPCHRLADGWLEKMLTTRRARHGY